MKELMKVSAIGFCLLVLCGCPPDHWSYDPVEVPDGGICNGTAVKPIAAYGIPFFVSNSTQGGRLFFDPSVTTPADSWPYKLFLQHYQLIDTGELCVSLVCHYYNTTTQAWAIKRIVDHKVGFEEEPYGGSEPFITDYDGAFFSDGTMAVAFLAEYNEPVDGCGGWVKKTNYLVVTVVTDPWQPINITKPAGYNPDMLPVAYVAEHHSFYIYKGGYGYTATGGSVRIKISDNDIAYVAASTLGSCVSDTPVDDEYECYDPELLTEYELASKNSLRKLVRNGSFLVESDNMCSFGPYSSLSPDYIVNNDVHDIDMRIINGLIYILDSQPPNATFQVFDENLNIIYDYPITDFPSKSQLVAMAPNQYGEVGIAITSYVPHNTIYYTQFDSNGMGTWQDISTLDVFPDEAGLGDLIFNEGDQKFTLFLDVDDSTSSNPTSTYALRKSWDGEWELGADKDVACYRKGTFRTRAGARPVDGSTTTRAQEWAFLHKRDFTNEGEDECAIATHP